MAGSLSSERDKFFHKNIWCSFGSNLPSIVNDDSSVIIYRFALGIDYLTLSAHEPIFGLVLKENDSCEIREDSGCEMWSSGVSLHFLQMMQKNQTILKGSSHLVGRFERWRQSSNVLGGELRGRPLGLHASGQTQWPNSKGERPPKCLHGSTFWHF